MSKSIVCPDLPAGRYEVSFEAIDTHTVGEPTRIIFSGFPDPDLPTMSEKVELLKKNYDHYRKAVMLEPRGHLAMFGAIVTKPVSKEAQYGIIFIESGGYLNMCGHGSIGFCVVAVETGMVEVKEPITTVTFDTPAGLIRGEVEVQNKRAKQVTIQNVPAFLYKENLSTKVDGVTINYDISFGGSFFALIDATQPSLNLTITKDNVQKFVHIGKKLLKQLNNEVEIRHPTCDIKTLDVIEFYGPSDTKGCSLRNIVIVGEGQVDRSPCGTGTSAKLAALYKKGKIKVNEKFVYESIIGTTFVGIVKEAIDYHGYTAVIPCITGSAYITGKANYVIDPNDSLRYGFMLEE